MFFRWRLHVRSWPIPLIAQTRSDNHAAKTKLSDHCRPNAAIDITLIESGCGICEQLLPAQIHQPAAVNFMKKSDSFATSENATLKRNHACSGCDTWKNSPGASQIPCFKAWSPISL